MATKQEQQVALSVAPVESAVGVTKPVTGPRPSRAADMGEWQSASHVVDPTEQGQQLAW